jgi:tetratricopeptide (TPR) repeat protein
LAAAYWQLNLKQKAYSSLKRSLILDPLNENAAIFYSDVCFFMSRIEGSSARIQDSISVLEELLNYEQRTKAIWEQAARAYYFVGKEKRNKSLLLRALESIKHLESIDSSPSTWNNMGLIAWELGDKKAAKRYLNFSLKKAMEQGHDADLSLYNLVGLLIESGEYTEGFRVLEPILEHLKQDSSEGKFIDKLKLQNIVLLEAVGRRVDALDMTKSYLRADLKDIEVKLDLLIRVIYYFTTYEPNLDKILYYEEQTLMTLDNETGYLDQTRARAINNLAFAFLNFDLYEKASNHLASINSLLYKDAFITATFGLAALKKGNIVKGRELYEKAMALLHDEKSKNQFRQRLNFELGKAELDSGDI